MPDAEEQRNLNAQQELYSVVADLEKEMGDDAFTEIVAPIIDAKMGFTHDEILSDRMLHKWGREIVPTKVLVLRTLADRLESVYKAGQAVERVTDVEIQDRAAFWNQYTGAN